MTTRRFVGALLAVLATMAPTSVAHAATVHDHTTKHSLRTTYFGVRHQVKKVHGPRAPGRNIATHGVRTRHGVRPATDRELARSIRTFRRWLSPPAPRAAAGDVAPTAFRSAASHTGGKWAIPTYIVMCESRGNYRAENPSGPGPSGAYQITDGTWKANGGSPRAPAAQASPAEQDEVAARIYAAQGAAPWACG